MKKYKMKIAHNFKLAKSRFFSCHASLMREVTGFEFNSVLLRYSVTVVNIVKKNSFFDHDIMNTYLKLSFYHGMSCYLLVTSSIPDLDIGICSFPCY